MFRALKSLLHMYIRISSIFRFTCVGRSLIGSLKALTSLYCLSSRLHAPYQPVHPLLVYLSPCLLNLRPPLIELSRLVWELVNPRFKDQPNGLDWVEVG